MDRRTLLFPVGLVLAAAYLSTATPVEHSFALDKPLHTAAVVLLLAGLLIAATEASTARLCPPPPSRHPPPYVAIPLRPAHTHTHTTHHTPPTDELWSDPAYAARRRPATPRAVAALLAVLLLALCARLGLFYRVTKDVECSAPSALAFVPLVLALAHSVRHPSQRQYPAWTADTRPRTLSDRVVFFFHGPSTRYIVPALLLSISSFLVAIKTSSLHSTYICSVANSTAATIPSLQFVGFLLDCLIAQLLYRLVDDAISPADEWTIQLQHGTSNNMLVGLTFIAASLVLIVAGAILYPAVPEYREWMLSFSSEYLLGLLRLSLMIPFMMLCFLKSARLYGVMSAVLTVAFSSAYIGVLRALGTGVSYSFPPKFTVGLVLCLTLLTIALILHLVTNTNIESRIRSTVPVRLGRNQSAAFILILIGFSIGVVVYRRQGPVLEHPISTLIERAGIQHELWESQACRSQTLAEAVVHYQQRYDRDPPPGFNEWYHFAVARNSIVVDDYDNIEEDLAPFSSFSPDDLRLRTATVLATNENVGGIRIRQGRAEAFANVSEAQQWKMDGTIAMIQQFAAFLPDMDLAVNLHDESRVAVPYDQLQHALGNPQPYPTPDQSRATKDFSTNRAGQWPGIDRIRKDPHFFEDARLSPLFQTYGSLACPPESRARKERHWNTKIFCSTCTTPHSLGAFISNWTLSADPCHQPDIANLHGMYLSPSNLTATHAIVPILSQSRAPGFIDIRYPSPWHYMEKTVYEFDEKSPDPHFSEKEDVLFWRDTTSEGFSANGAWKGMLRQRIVHFLNNETARQPILLPKGDHSDKLEYVLKRTADIKKYLETKTDVHPVSGDGQCTEQDCVDQARELGFASPVQLKKHWRYRYLFDTDNVGFSPFFIPFMQSNSVVFHTSLLKTWYTGRLTAWKHFVPVDVRLHDLFSSLAYFGGYGVDAGNKRMMTGRPKEAEAIARHGRVWTDKVLRKEDMEVYMFRLLLEWGRLTDDARTEVGFRVGKGGRRKDSERRKKGY